MLSFLSEEEGFGINTNLFETNILNLSVVIGVLIYYGRIAFVIRIFFYEFKINYIYKLKLS